MSHFDFVRPSGQWPAEYVPGQTDWWKFDVTQSKTIDGTAGGTYNPTAPIVIGGAGLQANAAASRIQGGVATALGGQIVLGDNDVPLFITPRTRSIVIPCAPAFAAGVTGWKYSAQFPGSIISTSPGSTINIPFGRFAHQGATLTSVTFTFIVGAPHPSTPLSPCGFQIGRLDATGTVAFLNSATIGELFPAPASGTAWFNGGFVQSFTYVCNQNNVGLDTTLYNYLAVIQDELGTGSVSPSKNMFISMTLNLTNIVDARFE